jgi:two-component sensor histidine kinase
MGGGLTVSPNGGGGLVSADGDLEAELREEARTLRTISRVNSAIAAELDLARLVQTVTDAGVELSGAEFGAFFYNVLNEQGESYMLYTFSGAPREAFASFPMPRNTAVFGPTFRGESVVRIDDVTKDPRYGRNPPYHGMPKGHLPVRSYLAAPVVARDGEVVGGLFFGHSRPRVFTERAERMITAIATQAAIAIGNARLYRAAQDEIEHRRKAEARQRLLMAELDHRVRNTLAVVQALATQVRRNDPEMAAFQGRLKALAQAYEVMSAGGWESAELGALLRRQLAAFDPAGRIGLSGPEIRLSARAAQSLVMAVHELATNAAKYGALSTPAGRIDVAWRAEERDGEESLVLSWKEREGPPVAPPQRRGVGAFLIEQGLAHELGGSARLSFEPGGAACEFVLPFRSVVAGEGDG